MIFEVLACLLLPTIGLLSWRLRKAPCSTCNGEGRVYASGTMIEIPCPDCCGGY